MSATADTHHRSRFISIHCPNHEDRNPSAWRNLDTGAEGCRKPSCGYRLPGDPGPVARATLAKVPDSVANPRECLDEITIAEVTTPCDQNTLVELMLAQRGIDTGTAFELGLRARRIRGEDWLVFVYRDSLGRPLYLKHRKADGSKRSMFRYPSRVESALFNLPELAALADNDEPMVVEGECDVAALYQVNVRGVVSVPDGAGSRITDALLAPLFRFPRILIGTDCDEDGERLACALVARLPHAQCRRVNWRSA